ncbi:metallophosphoesterase family protein [Humibacter ginsenosidimutans]|uniref:Metallophosphoesterase family protein n=2 Tax=Humibacter ginsenosidimutans TaxID=2599293 RepID=A0A5B8M7B4_9MICO|nr:metallophosphoesterase family protein [Humibacter ginsenosidimutans]
MSVAQVAVLSDVHGNLTAFEAVLADISARGIDTIYSLGDVAGKGPRGSQAVQLARERCAVNVRGNWDELLASDRVDDPVGAWWRDELTVEDRRWLGSLPASYDLAFGGSAFRLFHASAASVFTRVFEQHSPAEFEGMFANTQLTGPGPLPTVVCYGDIHGAYVKTVADRTLVNVGSVGNPLDETTACYVVLTASRTARPEAPTVEFVRVAYDREAEVAIAMASGMPEAEAYAIELRTAVYRGFQTPD